MGFVETDYLSLADYRLVPCTGCMKCFGYMEDASAEYKCYESDDDIKILAPKLLEYDGLLLGFPIYAGGIPALFRTFIEKLHFGPMSFTKYAGALRFKALGIISQGGQVYGGQESANKSMVYWGAGIGMYVANAWPTVDAPQPQSTFTSGILTCVDGTAIYGKGAWMKEGCRTVPPVSGSRNERTLKNLGRRLAIAAMIMKLGKGAFDEKGFKEPESISFTRYSVRPKSGSYLDKLYKEGKVTFVSQKDLEAEKKERI
jgi:multimeric flavodoxin WrbA